MLPKGICLLLSVVLFLVSIGGSPAYAQVPVVVVDGKVLETDAPPVIAKGRILVPMRAIFEALGAARITWLPEVNSVSVITREGKALGVGVGSPHAVFEGERFTLDVPPRIINGRIMVPLRFVGEMMGALVEWLSDSQTVRITSGAGGIGGPGLPLNGNGNGNGKKIPVINPLPDPIARARKTAQYLREQGYPVDLIIEDSVALVIDAAVPAAEQRMLHQEMLKARRAISQLVQFPEIPVALFLPPKEAYMTRFQCEYLDVPIAEKCEFMGNAGKRAVFFSSTPRVLWNDKEKVLWFQRALRHEYAHILQENLSEATGSMGVGGTLWDAEGGADYLALLSMKKESPEFYEMFWEGRLRFLQMTSRTLEGTTRIPATEFFHQSDQYTLGFFAWEYLVGEDVQSFIRVSQGPPRPLWDVWAAENRATWPRWFAVVFGISLEDFYEKFETEARPAILRGERPVWGKSGNRVALKSS